MKESNTFIRFGYRSALGTCKRLEESLKTRVYISSSAFERILKTGKFKLLGYDTSCKQVLWLNDTNETWLFIEYETY